MVNPRSTRVNSDCLTVESWQVRVLFAEIPPDGRLGRMSYFNFIWKSEYWCPKPG